MIAAEDGTVLVCLHWRQYVQHAFDENGLFFSLVVAYEMLA